jgi:hypothetical protein
LYNDSKPERAFDLIIISDVASPYMEAYKPSGEKKQEGFRKQSIEQLAKKGKSISFWTSIVLIALLALCLLVPLRDDYDLNFKTGICLGVAGGLLLLMAAKTFVVYKIKQVIKYLENRLKQLIPAFQYEKLSHLKIEKVTFGRVEPLILDRVNSLVTLLMDVFLKIVRRLNYDKLYDNPSFKYKRISNLIKELTEQDYNSKLARRAEQNNPLPAGSVFTGVYKDDVGHSIKEVVDSSSSFGTTLWFTDKPDALNPMLDQLVATGQLNMCYNLLMYLEELLLVPGNGFTSLDAVMQNNVKTVYEQCKSDWLLFKEDPMFMVKRLSI